MPNCQINIVTNKRLWFCDAPENRSRLLWGASQQTENADPISGYRWLNIKPSLVQRLVLAEVEDNGNSGLGGEQGNVQ